MAASKEDKEIQAREVMEKLLTLMDIDAQVKASSGEESITLNVEGPDGALLIGHDGSTVDALQIIINKMVNRFPGSRVPVDVDVAGFKARRIQALERTAQLLGKRAIETGRKIIIGAMSARDRRILHMTLRKMKGLATFSSGEGVLRRLIIEARTGKDHDSPTP